MSRPEPHNITKSLAAELRAILPPWNRFLLFSLLTVAIYWEIFAYGAFGPELGFFYQINSRRSFGGMLHAYIEFGDYWYRPTAFYTPYFLVSKLIGWHHILIWKLVNWATLLATCWALYALTLMLFPRQHLGAFLACMYLAAHPAVYLPLFEISAFDFPYLFFVLAAVMLFVLAWRAEPRRAGLLNLGAVASYVLALTSKETSVVTPVYLAAAAGVLSLAGAEPRGPQLRRAARLLAPHLAVLGLYLLLHVARMPARPVDADYRTKPNLARILENAKKYPMWMAHLFRDTGDTVFHVREQATPENDALGWLILVLWMAQWSCDFGDRAYRTSGILLACWILVFLSVPVYAGAYLWHNNLALCGYAVLAGVGLARFARLFPRPELRRLYVLALLALFLMLGRADVHSALYWGVHADAFKINTVTVLTHPPVPRARMGPAPYIWIENPQDWPRWAFGAGNLFALAYLNPGVQQEEVPAMDRIPPLDCMRWLARPDAYFFRYDRAFRWQDATAEFTRHALARTHGYAASLLAQNRGPELAAALAPVAARFPGEAAVQQDYAQALRQQAFTR